MVGKALLSRRIGWSADSSICHACRRTLQRRHASAATAPAAIAEPTPTPLDQHVRPVTQTTATHQAFDIKAGVVLSRPPLLTRDPSPFEREYFFYQRRLNERLVLPFTRYFYYQQDTPADIRWKKKMRERKIPGRDLGGYSPYGREGWNDEILTGEGAVGPEEQMEVLLNDAVVEKDKEESEGLEGEEDEEGKEKGKKPQGMEKRKIEEQVVEKPYDRITDADRQGDVKSLNRALSRTLYLLVREGQGTWRFPSGVLEEREDLHRAAERLLVQAGGINMNTWVLGHAPVGHYIHNFANPNAEPDSKLEKLGEKTFFMKARIMAGQPNLASNKLNLSDYQWLAKDEIQGQLRPSYWKAIRNMLVEL